MSSESASPPCMAGATVFSGDPADFDQVRRWRDGERQRLCAERKAIPPALREQMSTRLAGHLERFLDGLGVGLRGLVVGGYWPIKAEPDLRGWLGGLREHGAVLSLPVPETPPQPMTFRRWDADMRLERGFGNIPVPPAAAPQVRPALLFAPVIGWDDAGFRLGYGAGYFDRTLAALAEPPLTVGLGWQGARIASIVPQRHDVAMHAILTEDGVQVARRPLPLPRGWA